MISGGTLQQQRNASMELRALEQENNDEFLDDYTKSTARGEEVRIITSQGVSDTHDTLDKENQRLRAMKVPNGFVLTQLGVKVEMRHLTRELILHLPFLIMFGVWLFARVSVPQLYFNHDALYEMLIEKPLPPSNFLYGTNNQPYYRKTFPEVNKVEDIYSRLETVIAPALFPVNNTAPLSAASRLLNQAIPLGAVRFRSKHVRNDSCSVNTIWYAPATEYPCYGAYTSSSELTASSYSFAEGYVFNYLPCSNPWLTLSGRYATYSCSGYVVDVVFNTSWIDAVLIMQQLADGQFARAVSLRYFDVEFYIYDPVSNVFSSVWLIVEGTEGGGLIPWVRMKNFFAYDFVQIWVAFDIVFFLLYLLYVYRYFRDWKQTAHRTRRVWTFMLNLWNILQLVNLVVFLVVFALYAYYVALCAELPDVMTLASQPNYPEAVFVVSEVHTLLTYLNAVNTVISFAVVLKYVQLNHRLNLVQRTVQSAVGALVGVLLIFLLIVVAYGLAGSLLFGTSVAAYRNVSYAIISNFLALLGDFQYNELLNANRFFTFVYFWSFTILGLFMMLNFIVAILMGGFAVQQAQTKKKTLAQMLRSSVNRRGALWRSVSLLYRTTVKGRTMPEDHLYEKLDTTLHDLAENGEEEPESSPMDHTSFRSLLLKPDLEFFGEKYIETLWLDIASAFDDSLGSDPGTVARRAKAAMVYAAAREAASEVFTDLMEQITGTHTSADVPRRDDQQKVLKQQGHGRVSEDEQGLAASRLLSTVEESPFVLQRGARRGLRARSLYEAVLDTKLASWDLHVNHNEDQAIGVVPETRRAVDRMLLIKEDCSHATSLGRERKKVR